VESSGPYTVWTTDNNGNFINNNGVVWGTSASLESYEPVFGRDLNGDGVIGIYAPSGTGLKIGTERNLGWCSAGPAEWYSAREAGSETS
jgi:Tryptophan-rich Synechocystis species C-terminal domain